MPADGIREAELALLNAPFKAGGWAKAIDLVARATGAAGANMVAFGGPLPLSLNLFTGSEAALAERYLAQSELWGISEQVGDIAGEVHEISAWVLVALILVHVAAALKHQFFDTWPVSGRMPPFQPTGGRDVVIGQGSAARPVEG